MSASCSDKKRFEYEISIDTVIGIIGSIVFIAMLIYKLRFGKKAIRFDKHGRRGHQHLHGPDEHHGHRHHRGHHHGKRNEVTTID